MSQTNFNTYDFLINEDDEVILLLYTKNTPVKNPQITIDIETNNAFLQRNDSDGVEIKDISEDIVDAIQTNDKLLVCELSTEENDDDTAINNVYEAIINFQ